MKHTPALIPSEDAFEPLRITEVELSDAIPDMEPGVSRCGKPYRRAVVLVRLHSEPIGMITVSIGPHGVQARELTAQIWSTLAPVINTHLEHDGLAPVSGLSMGGIICGEHEPRCIKTRQQMLAEAPPISILIPTRDRPNDLRKALRTLDQLEYPHYDITIVDSAPKTSATYDLISREFPHVRYIREERPGSFHARNVGLRTITNEIVAFTDDDVLVDRHWLSGIARAFQLRPDVSCVTGLTMPAELEAWSQFWFEQYGGFNKGFEQKCYNIADIAEHRAENPLFPYTAGKFGSGVNMAFKTAALRVTGGFDPVLSNGAPARGGGDIDAYYRVIMRGESLVYAPSALVFHYHRRDYAALDRQIYNYGVGLSAFLFKCVLTDPSRALDIGARLPYGLYFALSPRSPKNRNKQDSYPRQLTRRELSGMLAGPLAYLRGRTKFTDTAY